MEFCQFCSVLVTGIRGNLERERERETKKIKIKINGHPKTLVFSFCKRSCMDFGIYHPILLRHPVKKI